MADEGDGKTAEVVTTKGTRSGYDLIQAVAGLLALIAALYVWFVT